MNEYEFEDNKIYLNNDDNEIYLKSSTIGEWQNERATSSPSYLISSFTTVKWNSFNNQSHLKIIDFFLGQEIR